MSGIEITGFCNIWACTITVEKPVTITTLHFFISGLISPFSITIISGNFSWIVFEIFKISDVI